MSVQLVFDEIFTSHLLSGLSEHLSGVRMTRVRELVFSNSLCSLRCSYEKGKHAVLTGSFVRTAQSPRVDVTISCELQEDGVRDIKFETTEFGAVSRWGDYQCAFAYFLLYNACKRGSFYGKEIHDLLGDLSDRGIPTPGAVLKPLAPLYEICPIENAYHADELEAVIGTPELSGEDLLQEADQECWFIRYLSSDDPRVREMILLRHTDTKDRQLGIQGRMAKVWDCHEVCRLASSKQSAVEGLILYHTRMTELRKSWLGGNDYDTDLSEFLSSEAIRDIERQVMNDIASKRLVTWLRESREEIFGATRNVVLEMFWSISGSEYWGELPRLTATVKVTTVKLKRSVRNAGQLQILMEQSIRGGSKLTPVQQKVISWFTSAVGHVANKKTNYVQVAHPGSLAEDLAGHSLLFWEDTSHAVKYRYDSAALSLMSTVPGDKLLWGVRFDDGAEVPLSDVVLFVCGIAGHRSLYVRYGDSVAKLDCLGIPAQIVKSLSTLGEVPLEKLRQEGVGGELLRHFRKVSVTANNCVMELPVRVQMEFRFSDNREIEMSVRAFCEEKNVVFHFIPQVGWFTDDAFLTEHEENSPILGNIPASADIVSAEEFLRKLIPSLFSVEKNPELGWSIRFGLNAFEDEESSVFELWEQRPRDILYLGDREFEKLVSIHHSPRISWSVTGESSGMNWLDVSLDFEQSAALDYTEVLHELEKQRGGLVRLSDGRNFRRSDLEDFCSSVKEIVKLGLDPYEKGHQRVHALQAGSYLSEMPSTNITEQLSELWKTFKGIEAAPMDESLRARLRSYQQFGVDFIVWACRNFGGALLADDMGLGKTLQVLCSIVALRTTAALEEQNLPSLVVCPASVVRNWQREAQRFIPSLRVLVLESGGQRKEYYGKISGQWDVVVMSYALARGDIEKLLAEKWLAVCADEAQVLKNPDGRSVKLLRMLHSLYRIGLTGTPVENRLMDLWSIMSFVIPGFLPGRSAWKKQVALNGESAYREILCAKLKPILLRRLKSEVAAELPPKIEEVLDCDMSVEQKRMYLAELKHARLLLEGGEIGEKKQFALLKALLRLRQICCHPCLVNPVLKSVESGKLSVLIDNVREILEEGHKVLVFSQFVKMLDIIARRFEQENIPFRMLTGATHSQDRANLVAGFEESSVPEAFLISLKAGGVGLNLTSASYVIIYDPWWNPAVEAQAIDRVHRIGQSKNVVAMRLVNKGTIEERVLELQERKRELFSSLFGGKAFNEQISLDDIRNLFN